MSKPVDLSRADLNLLVLFEVVLEERHVGRAAARLNLSPSAVSHGLGRLRRLLDDPLFLKTPKGVAPTARAEALAEPIADVLARARRVLASAEPFDPARSARRFTLGAPDGISAVLLPDLLEGLGREAPGIDVGVRQLLPSAGVRRPERAWDAAFEELDARAVDVAVLPIGEAPQRFACRTLYEEDFVVGMRRDHPFGRSPTLEAFCAAGHLVVSLSGEPRGFVDEALEAEGLSRRVAATAPHFMLALALLADTDLLAALPRAFVRRHGPRLGVEMAEPPTPLGRFRITAVAPRAALLDEGLAWFFQRLAAPAG